MRAPRRRSELDRHELDPHLTGAAEAAARVGSDPEGARSVAIAKLAEARRSGDSAACCRALHTIGLACLELGDLPAARQHLDEALHLASGTGAAALETDVRATSAAVWFQAGDAERALHELAAALASLGDAKARAALFGQRAQLMFRLGRMEAGLSDSEDALALARGASDAEAVSLQARILSNRGTALAIAERYGEALGDLSLALDLHRSLGSEFHAAQVLHNLGFVATRLGDIPEAIARFGEAHDSYEALGIPTSQLLADRCELLRLARLLPEARRAAEDVVADLDAAGLVLDAAEARLGLAMACLDDGDPDAARTAATAAADAFAAQQRADWAVLALEILERLERAGMADLEVVSSAAGSAERLEAAGWRRDALGARIEAARAALRAGTPALAEEVLDSPGEPLDPGDPDRLDGVAAILSLHAEGLRAACRGETEQAHRALAQALDLASDRSTVLRATSGIPGHGRLVAEIADSGLQLLIGGGEAPEALFEWAERSRPGGRLAPSLSSVRDMLGAQTLLEFVTYCNEVLAVVVSSDVVTVTPAGDATQLSKAVATCRFAVAQLLRGRAAMASRLAAVAILRRQLSVLDQAVAPLVERAPTTERGRVVIVPSGPLHGAMWGMLPCLREREFLVAPSAAAWSSYAGSPPPTASGGEILLVDAPGTGSGARELRAIRAVWAATGLGRRVRLLAGRAATRSAVTSGLARAEIAHIAAHGTFRADNPMMSSLACADGDLTVYEMAAASPPPRPACLFLSACDTARVGDFPGEEVAGVVPSLLGFGTGVVVAGATELPDQETPAVALEVHRHLAAGEQPPAAVRAARVRFGDPMGLTDDQLAAGTPEAKRALAASALVCAAGSPAGV